jgi:hypothetical protein
VNILYSAGRISGIAGVICFSFIPGPIRAAAADSLPDTTYPNLVGSVSNMAGVAVTNASIFIYTAGPRHGWGIVCPSCYADCHKSTQSDSSGKFEIKSVSPALVFRVLVVAPDYLPGFFDNVDPLKGPLDAKLSLRSKENIPRQQTIIGRVVNTTNEPLVNAVVSVEGTTIGNMTYGSPPKGTDPLAITDENGEFSIQSTTNFNDMNLRVEARGYAREAFPQIRPGLKRRDFVVSGGAALTGQVLWNGQPLTNVSVGTVGVDRSIDNFTGDFIIGTDENGRFLFVNLPPDRDYTVYGLMNSFKTFGALPARLFHAGKDDSVTDLGILEVVPGHRLAGQVKLSDTQPVPEHTHLFISRQNAWDTSVDIELPADGRFEFTNVPVETITLSTRIKGYGFSRRNASLDQLNPSGLVGWLDSDKTNLIVLLEPGANPEPDYSSTPDAEHPEKLPLAGAETKRVIPNAVIISGRALDVETKRPILKFHVTPGIRRNPNIPDWIEWFPSKTSEGIGGNFDLTLLVKTDSTVLMAEADGYLPAQSTPLNRGQTNWTFELKKGVGPSGSVRQPDGRPATNVTVLYLTSRQQGYLDDRGRLDTILREGGQQKQTDADGHFRFKPKPGVGEIFAASSDGFAKTAVESVATNFEMKLEPWARVRGRLVQQGKPAGGENVDLFAPVFGPAILNLPGAVTDDEGRFSIGFVPPGDMRISTRVYMDSGRSGWRTQSQRRFTARPGEDVNLGDVVKIDSD